MAKRTERTQRVPSLDLILALARCNFFWPQISVSRFSSIFPGVNLVESISWELLRNNKTCAPFHSWLDNKTPMLNHSVTLNL